jgi:dTDP-glucose 4,6-dehydratase
MVKPLPMARLPQLDLDHILSHTPELWEDLRGQSVFMTGGTGFVGTWLLESLLCANDRHDLRVDVFVLTRDPERFRGTAPHLAGHPAVHLLGGDVLGFDFPEGPFPFVIHAATARAFEPNYQRPLGAFDADIDGSRRVLDFARSRGVRRFLFTSSGAVYGRQPPELTHIPEDYAGAPVTTDTGSAYGQAKRVSEFMSAMYGRAHGFDAMIARLFAFVGPILPLDANYAIGNFIGDALKGGPVRIAGDGTPYRSYLYAADLAIWLWTILLKGKAAYPYNVGSPDHMSIERLARLVVDITAPGMPVEIARHPAAGAPAPRYVPSTERAEKELGLRSYITPEQGIRRTYEWYRACGRER